MKINILPCIKFCFFYISFCTTYLFSTELEELYPSALMKHETQWLMKVLEQAHYNKVSIDELNSTAFIDRFVEKLDKQKLYFTQNDINEFHNNYSKTIKTHLKQGNLLPGFEIYNIYKNKYTSKPCHGLVSRV